MYLRTSVHERKSYLQANLIYPSINEDGISHQNSMKQINCGANTTNDNANCTEVHATCINFEAAKIIFAVQEL